MTRGEIRRFRRVLEDLKAELVQTLQDRIDRLVISQAADPMDQIRNSTEQELDSRSISLLTRRLRRIEDALRAIRDGTFGTCTICEREIPQKRLEALPWSFYCLKCQEDIEARGAGDDLDESVGSGYALAG